MTRSVTITGKVVGTSVEGEQNWIDIRTSDLKGIIRIFLDSEAASNLAFKTNTKMGGPRPDITLYKNRTVVIAFPL